MVGGGWCGKQVRHRCGTVLSSRVLGVLEWSDEVVVEYRDETGLVVSVCPGCEEPLKLWWSVPDGVSQAIDAMRSFLVDEQQTVR